MHDSKSYLVLNIHFEILTRNDVAKVDLLMMLFLKNLLNPPTPKQLELGSGNIPSHLGIHKETNAFERIYRKMEIKSNLYLGGIK